MNTSLAWQDHSVIAIYLLSMLALGAYIGRRQRSEDDYFLAGRRMPWFAVGVSVIASLLSSLTYLSEPGEIWKSGVTHMAGKMLAIPFEMAFVWLFAITFLMRFRFTTAYEYLGARFGMVARRLGVVLFFCLVISWMGFVVLVSSRVLAEVTGVPLGAVIATVGVIATIYTTMGGLRAVIWTDVIQVALLIGGAVFVVAFISVQTESNLGDWYGAVSRRANTGLKLWSVDPFMRATTITVAVHMFVWHICTHMANQMTAQRYLSTSSLRDARRSFVTGSLLGVGINLLLATVGMALFYYYMLWPDRMPAGVDPASGKQADQIFPLFVVQQMPAGTAGAVIAALLAAGMSSIDSGVNSIATVLTIERWHSRPETRRDGGNHLAAARLITIVAGFSLTLAAFGLDWLTGDSNIVEMMPRSFNCFTGALGGLFFIGIFLRRAGQRHAVLATCCGLATSISIAYGKELFQLEQPLSFTWVMPGSLAVTLLVAWITSLIAPVTGAKLPGLTWYTRNQANPLLDAPADASS